MQSCTSRRHQLLLEMAVLPHCTTKCCIGVRAELDQIRLSFWQDFQQWLLKEDIIQKSVLWQVRGVYFTERHVQVHWVESHCTILLWRLHVGSLVRHWSPGHCQKGLHCTPLQETVSWVEAREKPTNAVDHNGWKAMPCCCHVQEQALSATWI